MSETVKGFKDIEGKEAEKRLEIQKILIEEFEKYGFEPAETPVIEYEEFVKGENTNDEAVSDIFKLKDRGERALALRYEFTFQLKRLALNKKLPYKRFQLGPVFRDEPIGQNRFRQFTQCDVDIIGSTIKNEAEIISLVSNILRKINVKNTIFVNNRKLLNEILESQGIKNKEAVIREIDKIDKLPEKEIKENLKKFNAEKIINILKNKEDYFEKYSSYKEIQELKKYCQYYKIKIQFQPFLARGLSYYNGNIIEISSDIKKTICAGGSYLVNGIQSTGMSFGLDRLAIVSKLEVNPKKVLVVSIDEDKKAIELAENLRNNISCSLFFGKPGKALEYANAKSFDYALLIGDREVKNKKYTLKDMKSGKETNLSEKELIKKLKG